MKIRVLASSVTFAVVIAVLSGCGATDEGGGDTSLTMWTPLTGDDGAYMEEIVDAYNATDPEYTIDFEAVPELYTKISTAYNAGSGLPEFAIIHGANLQELAPAGVIEPITSWLEAEPELVRDNYIDVAWDGAALDGEQFGVPLDLVGIIGYYNIDLVEQYGATSFLDDGVVTVDELLSLEGKLPEGVFAFPPAYNAALVATWVYGQGGSFDPEGGVDLTSPEYKAAYEALIKLQQAGLIAPEDADSAAVFNTGHALFFPDGTWGYTTKTAIDGLNFAEMNSIQLTNKNPVNVLGGHVFAQFADGNLSEAQESGIAAFVEYVRTNSIGWAEAGQVVASREVYDSTEYAAYPQSFLTSTEDALGMIRINNSPYSGYIGVQLGTRTNDIVWERVSVEQGLQEMQDEIAARLEEAAQG